MNPLTDDYDYVQAGLGALWDEFRGKRIFITGGTGFFGCWLLESLAWANRGLGLQVEIVVLTRNPADFARKCPHLAGDPSISLFQGDVVDFAFPPGSFSHVIHAATQSSAPLTDDNILETFDTIVNGMRRVLEFSRGAGVEKILFTSSGAVYGKQPADLHMMPEDYPGSPDCTNPMNVYGEGKRTAELLCALYAHKYGFETKIARCFAFVGPYLPLSAHFAIGNFIRDGMRGGPIVVQGDGTPYRSYLYAADLAMWLLTILAKGESCRPYNVGSDEGFTIEEIARMVAQCFDPVVSVEVRLKKDPAKKSERYVPSVERAKRELGLEVGIGLREGIEKTIAWNTHLKNHL
jgi:dTDP-glucose 4,6-dehydratase